jgi:long-chain acyl-CoA synthetase
LRRAFAEKRYEDIVEALYYIVEALYSDADVVHIDTTITYEDGRKSHIKTDLHIRKVTGD